MLRLTVAFREDKQVARRQRVVAEKAQAHLKALFFEEQGAIEHQPHLQWPTEQVAHALQIAYFGQALPAGGFQSGPVRVAIQGQLLKFGQVAAVLLEGLFQPGYRQRRCRQVFVALALLAL